MPMVKKYFLMVAAVLVTAVVSVRANPATMADIQEAAGTIRSIRADFIQEKHMKILVKPLISKGIIRFQSPDSLRFEYREPIQNILIMQDKSVSRYIRKDGDYVRDNAAAMGAMTIVMDEISQWLKGNFNTSVFNATIEETPKPGRIILAPKDKAMTNFIQDIVLVLSERPGVFKEVIIRENLDSYTRLRFDKVQLNKDIAPEVFAAPK